MNQEQFIGSSNLDKIRELSEKLTADSLHGRGSNGDGELNIDGVSVAPCTVIKGQHIPASCSPKLKIFIIHSGGIAITVDGEEYIADKPGSFRYVEPMAMFSVLFISDTSYTCLSIPVNGSE